MYSKGAAQKNAAEVAPDMKRRIGKLKFALSCAVLIGYAAYTAYALYYYLAFATPLGTALLALVGATLALTATVTVISYRVNLRGKPRPRARRLIMIGKLTLQLAATALTVIFFITAARLQEPLPWVISGISAATVLIALAANIGAEIVARKFPDGIGKKVFLPGRLQDEDGEEADISRIIAAVQAMPQDTKNNDA